MATGDKLVNLEVLKNTVQKEVVDLKSAITKQTRNLFNPYTITVGSMSAGRVSSGNNYISDYIPVEAGQTYIYSGNCSRGTEEFAVFDSSKTYLTRLFNNKVTIPEGGAYIRLELLPTVPLDQVKLQFEKGESATEYVPYMIAYDFESQNALPHAVKALSYNWELKTFYDRTDGSYVSDANVSYIGSAETEYLVFPYGAVVRAESGYRFNVYQYTNDANHTFISASNWISGENYYQIFSDYSYKIVLGKIGENPIALTEIVNLDIVDTTSYYLYNMNGLRQKSLSYSWERNIWYERSDGSAVTGLTTDLYIATPVSVYMSFPYGAFITAETGFRFNAYRYKNDTNHTFVDSTSWVSGDGYYFAVPGYTYKFVLGRTNGKKITDIDTIRNLTIDETKSYFAHRSIDEQYSTEINETVKRALSDKDKDTVTFALMTDSHNISDKNTVGHCTLLASITDKCGGLFSAHMGDIIEGYGASKDVNKSYLIPMWREMNLTHQPALYAIGHHELYGKGRYQQYLNDPTAISPSEAVGIWGKNTKWLNPVFSANSENYYFDAEGIRFIFVNGCSTESTIGFNSEVLSFVETALTGCTLPVVVFSHVAANRYANLNDGAVTDGTALEQLLNNYGNVIAFFHGHTHFDNIAVPDGGTYPYISLCSSLPIKTDGTCTLGTPTAWDRTIGTITEYCIDIVNIHRNSGTVRTFRFGAGVDREYIKS